MMLEQALETLRSAIEPGRAAQMAAYHKQTRDVLGISNPDINQIAQNWRQTLDVPARVSLARDLWDTDIFEARIAAAKLLTQARLRPDEEAWTLIQSWVPDFDSWAIADHVCSAGSKRLIADPTRVDQVETWTKSDHMWTRRAALVIMLPWTKQNFPKPAELEIRDRVLGWAAGYVTDPDWFIQKSVSWWLRDLSKHDPDRTRAFLAQYGDQMKPFARKDAARKLP
ncbi:DNA alkylation repair protein [Aestuariibius sp. HNIBRBA575]|uniref:DNA alkylation repair protein n=1 Tax=Aestuariibius sp. HNIBRBA575 TaxID=3233343 RepID=UPI0034A1CC61